MKIGTNIINPHLIILTFETRKDITSTLLRFQEYYESPEFRGKIFSLKEFKKWYTKNSVEGKKTGKFTYYEDWSGFNIPSYIFDDFIKGKFNPLSIKERKVLDLISKMKKPFYVIAYFNKHKNIKNVLTHELKHTLFYTDRKYKKDILNVLSKHDFSKMKIELANMGYNKAVFNDEIHAFATDNDSRIKYKVPKQIKNKLSSIFDKYNCFGNLI